MNVFLLTHLAPPFENELCSFKENYEFERRMSSAPEENVEIFSRLSGKSGHRAWGIGIEAPCG
jgi:hypothetical protein